jgi:CheY-like chemotaxis protein
MNAKKVILVEDDPDDRELFLIFYSEREDISLLPPVGNGEELIAYLKEIDSEEQLPQLIVLDQNMPKMNGKQTLAVLQSDDRYSKIPAVIYSTHADSNLIAACKLLGARMVASKPIDHKGYQKMMDDFLQIF